MSGTISKIVLSRARLWNIWIFAPGNHYQKMCQGPSKVILSRARLKDLDIIHTCLSLLEKVSGMISIIIISRTRPSERFGYSHRVITYMCVRMLLQGHHTLKVKTTAYKLNVFSTPDLWFLWGICFYCTEVIHQCGISNSHPIQKCVLNHLKEHIFKIEVKTKQMHISFCLKIIRFLLQYSSFTMLISGKQNCL